MSETEHGSVQLFLAASDCPHPEPPEPESDDDTGWSTWDEWHGDHVSSSNFNGDLICLLTPADTACPACTEVAREEEDLPLDEYVQCRLVPARESEERPVPRRGAARDGPLCRGLLTP